MIFVFGPLWFVAAVMVAFFVYAMLRRRGVVTMDQNWKGPALTEWVVYTGTTPPLRLKICFAGSEAFRQTLGHYASTMGHDDFEQLEEKQQALASVHAIASTFVVDWDRPGTPYTIGAMTQLLCADSNLGWFVINEMKRRSGRVGAGSSRVA